MNKKVNTLLFILCATLFNIIIALVSFIVFVIIYLKFQMQMPESSRSWAFAVIFLASIGVSFLVYRIVLKHLIEKIDIEKYFDPLFVGKYKGKNR
jgi:phosphoglycerol transferase MdoB-like AlkP superfamily enzyme